MQEHGGFETPADSGTLTNFVEIGQARDKILSLKLDQVRMLVTVSPLVWALTVLQVSGTASTSGSATSIDRSGAPAQGKALLARARYKNHCKNKFICGG